LELVIDSLGTHQYIEIMVLQTRTEITREITQIGQ